MPAKESRQLTRQGNDAQHLAQLWAFKSRPDMDRPLQGGANIWELAQGKTELFFQQPEELPGPLAVFHNLVWISLRPNSDTRFSASSRYRSLGQQLEDRIKLKGVEIFFSHEQSLSCGFCCPSCSVPFFTGTYMNSVLSGNQGNLDSTRAFFIT